VGSTGQRAFGTNSGNAIYFNNSGTPIAASMTGASILQ
jgi:hypothetical protein